MTDDFTVFFALLGSTHIKASHMQNVGEVDPCSDIETPVQFIEIHKNFLRQVCKIFVALRWFYGAIIQRK